MDSKRKAFLLLSVAVLIILSVLIFINSRTPIKSVLQLEGADKLEVIGEVGAISNSSSLTYCTNNLLLEAQTGNLRAKNIKGEVVWSQGYTGTILKITSAGNNIITIDSGNNISYYSEQGKLLWNYKSPLEIIDVYTEDNGSILVEYRGLTGGRAEVFSQNGNKIGNISVENAHILSFATGTNSFSIAIVDLSGETVKTKIITYNLKGDILWANNFENELITKLNYSKNNRLLAVGENKILSFKSDGKLLGKVKTEGSIRSVAMSDYLTVVVVSQKGKFYTVCYDLNNKQQCCIEMSTAPSGVYPLKNNFIVYYEDELIVLNVKGNVIAAHKSNTDISRVYMTMDDKVYIVSNRKLQLLKYGRM